jgi:hypothetical protein
MLSKTSPGGASDNQPGLLLGDDLPGARREQHQHPASSASGRRPLRRNGSLDTFCGSVASEKMEEESKTSFFTCFLSKGCGCFSQEKSLQMLLPLRKNP